MSKPKTETGRVLRTAGNIVNSFSAHSRTEIHEHEENALAKLDAESGKFIREVFEMSGRFGNPMDTDICPTSRVRSHIDPHLHFMRPSLAQVYKKLAETMYELKQRTIPRLTPGILNLISEVDKTGEITPDELKSMSVEYFDSEGVDEHLFFMEYTVGGKTNEHAETVQKAETIGQALELGLGRMWTPIFLERVLHTGNYIVSPLGACSLKVTMDCFEANPQEPIAGSMLQYR